MLYFVIGCALFAKFLVTCQAQSARKFFFEKKIKFSSMLESMLVIISNVHLARFFLKSCTSCRNFKVFIFTVIVIMIGRLRCQFYSMKRTQLIKVNPAVLRLWQCIIYGKHIYIYQIQFLEKEHVKHISSGVNAIIIVTP